MLHLLPTDPAIYLLQILTLKALFKSILHDEAQRFLLNTLISLTSGEAPPTKRYKSKSIMANSSVFLADLKASRCTSTAQVRLLRFWEDRNVKSDDRGCPDFKLSDSPVSIRFNIETGLKDLTDPGSPIPQERFRFCKDELLGLANTNTHLPETSFLIYPSRYELIDKFFLRACPFGIMPDGSGGGGGLREETAENESCLADVEVKLLEFDAMIKKLSRRRPGQLIKTIAFFGGSSSLYSSHLHDYHGANSPLLLQCQGKDLYAANIKAGLQR
ncbi:unnamed protein product [Brassica napus]|uniref:(rape) hypothetical protein n=1 Tax=Brassica napus TaxID=3708 RepID=A0A816MSZ0_BRANA|nr:unnamed protein product [Brassica napus]